ncbi:MAG: type II toxin-antitoxin system RelE/ParE family toxin [Cloacibacillus porcorum]|nr:type II toxin-antitoxin system RelE/ParE family toxin [Cloacibacillus porcorum]
MPNWKEDMPTRKLGELNRQAEHLLTSTKIMIFEIEISAQADADLRGVYEYIAFELRSPENARGQLDRLEKSIISLSQMPERFREYENEPWHSRGLRVMPVGSYCVFYILNIEKAVVTIIRVMYGGRDIEAQLKKNAKI